MAILFTEKYVELIQHARELNRDNKISGDIYFHPQEGSKKIIVKTIDLAKPDTLFEVNSRSSGKSVGEEHWLEAYIISKSKKHNWEFSASDKTYSFLSSQLRFRTSPLLKSHVITDVLLYDDNNKNLVIWELKKNRDINTAIEELNSYVEELKRLFLKDEKENALRAFGLSKVIDVVGYVVCPQKDGNIPTDTKKFGLYEFSSQYPIIENGELIKPWNIYKELKKEKRELLIDFELK